MSQFALVDSNSEMQPERYDSLDAAVRAATKAVTEDPDSSLDVIQLLKTVTSKVEVGIEDI